MLVYEPTAFRDSDGRVAMKFFGNFASVPGGSRVRGIALKPCADRSLSAASSSTAASKWFGRSPMSRFHEPDGSSRAEYAVWHEPQLSTYVCGGMRRRFGECFLYPSCASASPTIPQSKRPVNPQRYLFSMRSLLAAFAVGWTATNPERREEYVNAAFSRHLRERGGRDAAPLFVALHPYVRRLTRHSVPTAPRAA